MTAPVLDPVPEIIADYGETVTVDLNGRVDSAVLSGTATLTDDDTGETATAEVKVTLPGEGTYSLEIPGALIVQDTADLSQFRVTMPEAP